MYDKKRIKHIRNKTLVVDNNTGTIDGLASFDNAGTLVLKKRAIRFDRRFTVIFQDAALQLAKDELTARDFSVLLACLATMDFQNYITATQTELAKLINCQRTSVNASMRKLQRLGYLQNDDGRYRVSSMLTWRGHISDYRNRFTSDSYRDSF